MSIYRIAVDGPAGAGKSTLAKLVAKELGIDYVDTGAMYRAIALKLIRTGTDCHDPKALAELLANTDVDFDAGKTLLDGEDVSGLIRTQEVSEMASVSSAVQAVRDKLVALQQAMGKRKSLVMDGRDIGTTVFPEAEIKIFMIATPEVRAQRRFDEMKAKGQDPVFEDVMKNLLERDYIDSHREVSPLSRADDAYVMDNSDMTLHEETVWFQGLCQGKFGILE